MRKTVIATAIGVCLAFAPTALAAPAPFPVTTGMVQNSLMLHGLSADAVGVHVKTKVTRAVCTPGAPPIRGIGYAKIDCLIWTPTGHSSIVVSTFTRDGSSWFYRWRFA